MRNDIVLSGWVLEQSGPAAPDDFPESVFFIGNGRFGVRGYMPCEADYAPVRRGLFMAGIFGEIKPGITDFVNLPTPVYERLLINGVQAVPVGSTVRRLDLKKALFTCEYTLAAGDARIHVEHIRFMPAGRPSLLLQRTKLIPEHSMKLKLISGIRTDSCNSPIPDDQTKNNTETVRLAPLVSSDHTSDTITTQFMTTGTNITVKQTVMFSECGAPADSEDLRALSFEHEGTGEYVLDKLTHIASGRDVDPRLESVPTGFDLDSLLDAHISEWVRKWEKCEIALDDPEEQTALRFAMYQLMASCSRLDPTVSIGARGLTHARYKGCYFWDGDMFMLPFFIENDPQAAKSLCEYRVRCLPAAKLHALKMNGAGARYPWMAAFDGTEQCETWDIGCSEVHVTADIAYAIDKYCSTCGDRDFYLDKAAEVYIETARFWMSRYSFSPDGSRADLLWVKGPDEYCGVSINNLYTNVMVRHNLALAIKAAEDLKAERPESYAALCLSEAEPAQWQHLSDIMVLPRDSATGRLTTDELFPRLEPVDISLLKKSDAASYHDICFDRLQRYKVVKQADVLLLMTRLPELFTREEKLAAWKDFEPICLHDSTLSFASHALFALENGLDEVGRAYLKKALLLDLRDIMGNTGKEGLHLANMGEAWQACTKL